MTVNEKPAINERIEDLNLISLRKYACPKIQSQNDWYLKCIECLGRDGCPAGKRAIEIIETQTKPEQKTQVQKFNDRLQKTLDLARKSGRSSKFIDAIEKSGDDPAEYLYNLGGYPTKWRARDALKKWLHNHGLSVAEVAALNDGNRTQVNKVNSKKAADSRTLKARDNITRLFEGLTTKEERIRVILENETKEATTGHTIRNRMCNWKTKYPDLFGKYDLQEVYRDFTAVSVQKMTLSELKDHFLTKDIPVETEEDDEVSIEDFLAENEEPEKQEEPTPSAEPEKEEEETMSTHTTSSYSAASYQTWSEEINSLVNYSTDLLLREQFDSKVRALETEFKNATEQVNKWTAWRSQIRTNIDTLYSAMAIMGLKMEDEDDE